MNKDISTRSKLRQREISSGLSDLSMARTVTIVNPIFLDHQIYTQNPVTTAYPNGVIVVNLDFYGLGGDREVSLLIFKDNDLIKVDWNEEHRPWAEHAFKARQP